MNGRTFDVALVEWPHGLERGGPHLVGRTSDARIVALVRESLAAETRRELAELEGTPVRLVGEGDDE